MFVGWVKQAAGARGGDAAHGGRVEPLIQVRSRLLPNAHLPINSSDDRSAIDWALMPDLAAVELVARAEQVLAGQHRQRDDPRRLDRSMRSSIVTLSSKRKNRIPEQIEPPLHREVDPHQSAKGHVGRLDVADSANVDAAVQVGRDAADLKAGNETSAASSVGAGRLGSKLINGRARIGSSDAAEIRRVELRVLAAARSTGLRSPKNSPSTSQ